MISSPKDDCHQLTKYGAFSLCPGTDLTNNWMRENKAFFPKRWFHAYYNIYMSHLILCLSQNKKMSWLLSLESEPNKVGNWGEYQGYCQPENNRWTYYWLRLFSRKCLSCFHDNIIEYCMLYHQISNILACLKYVRAVHSDVHISQTFYSVSLADTSSKIVIWIMPY